MGGVSVSPGVVSLCFHMYYPCEKEHVFYCFSFHKVFNSLSFLVCCLLAFVSLSVCFASVVVQGKVSDLFVSTCTTHVKRCVCVF